MFEFSWNEPLNLAIRRLLEEEVEEAISLLTSSDIDQGTAVHGFRKSIKRTRALIRLIRSEIGEMVYQRENHFYRDASRKLSPLRDSAVMVETLDFFGQAEPSASRLKIFGEVREQLYLDHTQMVEHFINNSGIFEEITHELEIAKERIQYFQIEDKGFSTVEPGLRRIYGQAKNRMKNAYGPNSDPALFHEWRKSVKYAWHHVELFRPAWPPVLEALGNEFHVLSDMLGEAHDTVVLIEYLEPNEGKFRNSNQLRLLKEILMAHMSSIEEAAKPIGRKIFAENPDAFVNRMRNYWLAWTSHPEK